MTLTDADLEEVARAIAKRCAQPWDFLMLNEQKWAKRDALTAILKWEEIKGRKP